MSENERYAAIFDVDGTLHDSENFILTSYEFSLSEHGLSVPDRNVMKKNLGKTLQQSYEIYAPGEDILSLMKTHTGFQEEHPGLLKPFPDTLSTLKKIKEVKGYKIAVATSRTKVSAIQNLELTGIFGQLDHIATKNDVKNPKPDPEIIYQCLDKLEVKPGNAFMVGDSDADILAGKNAGLTTVAFANYETWEKFIEVNPDYIIDTLADIMPLVLLKLKSL